MNNRIKLENYKGLNLQHRMRSFIESNRISGNHTLNADILIEQLENVINVTSFLGGNNEKLLENLLDLVKYQALNFHKSDNYYPILNEWNKNYGRDKVSILISLIDEVKNQTTCKICKCNCSCSF